MQRMITRRSKWRRLNRWSANVIVMAPIVARSHFLHQTLVDDQHFDQAHTWQHRAARFIRIMFKDFLQLAPVQGIKQQRDDCGRLQQANPPWELYLAMSVYLTPGGFAVPLRSVHSHRPS